jgi:protein-tyrosine phosphatase
MAPVDRTLRVQGIVNGRDLGGLPRRRSGGVTPLGVFWRSESVERVGADGWDQVYAAGIRSVVDVRQPDERRRDTGILPDWLTTIHVDLDGLENEAFWATYLTSGTVGTALYFLPHLAAMPERAGAVLTALATAPFGGVLFHCEAGRDRTGLVSLLLLMAADVEPQAVVDDYLETVRLGDARSAATGQPNREAELEALCQRLGTSTEKAFRDALVGLRLDEFLERSGMTSDEIRAIRTWRGSIEVG